MCNAEYQQTLNRFQLGRRHLNCPEVARIKKEASDDIKRRVCKQCKGTFIEKRAGQVLCNSVCRDNYGRARKGTGFYEKWGRIGGRISASRQTRRSINEIYFYNLCCWVFDEVLNNVPIFDEWDCDVIAISWNGIYHYKKVTEKHNLEQVQSRDAIKDKIVINHGYKHYIIKDMGSKSKKFVESEFEKFMVYCSITLDPEDFEAMKNRDNWKNAKDIQRAKMIDLTKEKSKRKLKKFQKCKEFIF